MPGLRRRAAKSVLPVTGNGLLARIGLLSDLHVDVSPFRINTENMDVLVVAGDIMDNTRDLSDPLALHQGVMWLLESTPSDIPVLFVPGNHDVSFNVWEDAIDAIRRTAEGTHVHVLCDDEINLAGLRFVGSPLFSDLRDPLFSSTDVDLAASRNSDLASLWVREAGVVRPSAPADFINHHKRSRAYLEGALSLDRDLSKTVVISHWSPSFSQAGAHPPSPGRSYWASDQEDLVSRVPLWVFGHTHQSGSSRIGLTPGRGQLISNQRGYSYQPDASVDSAFNASAVIRLSDFTAQPKRAISNL